MYYPDPMLEKQEYEERVRWLKSVYSGQAELKQPNQASRLANHLLCVLGRYLVSLGERMQSRHDTPVSSPTMK